MDPLRDALMIGLGAGVTWFFGFRASRAKNKREAEHWSQAMLHVLDFTDEVERQGRTKWQKKKLQDKFARVSDTQQLLRGHAGPRVAPHIATLRGVHERLIELNRLCCGGGLTEDGIREAVENAASLAQEVEALRAALE